MTANRPTRAKVRKADKSKDSVALPQELSDRLDHLARLPQNWDSYGAVSINPKAIERVRSILREIFAVGAKDIPHPFIAPANDGTLVLEWETANGKELILDVPPDDEPASFLLVEPEAHGKERETEGLVGEPWTLAEVIGRLLVR
jgi:hypothetical protein